ncbi:MAG: long-chain fatty acid--CoA ligase, partial [Mycobacterium sp.]
HKFIAKLSASRAVAKNQTLDESHILEHILRTNRIDIPAQSGPLTYRQAEELVHQRGALEFAFPLPPQQLLEFMAQSVKANQLRLAEHVPGVFDGDMVIFSAARGRSDNGGGPRPRSRWRGLRTGRAARSQQRIWRPYVAGEIATYSVDSTHLEMLTADSLRAYGEHLKLLLQTQVTLR